MDANFEQARAFFIQGVQDYEAGRFEAAERQFSASLALLPGRPSTLTNLSAARLKLGRFEEAEAVLAEALQHEPDNAEALGHRATALAELGRHAQALDCASRALAQGDAPAAPAALWTLQGNLLKDLGRTDEARAAFRKAIERGGDPELNGYYLAGLAGQGAPARPPRAYVQGLFDSYAGDFEEHLTHVLRYDAPAVLAQRLSGRRFAHALDLGCGTGLCGLQLRPLADRLTGVDLSANMVAQARQRGVYDELAQADALEFLRANPGSFDAVVAADVFVYVGALEAVFEAASQALRPGGVFAFTVELLEGPMPWTLRPSLRYAHSAGYIRTLTERNGFEFLDTATRPIREDQRTPIAGLFAWLLRH